MPVSPLHILPAIDLRGGRCVRLQQGDYARETVYSDDPVAMARQWEAAGAPLLHLVDLDGARAGQPVNLAVVRAICAALRIPCELGGGIRTVADAQAALAAGVSRVILGTTVAERPELLADFLARFTPAQLVAGIDARDGRVAVRGWEQTAAVTAVDLARRLAAAGCRRFIYTDIRTDGMGTGPNLAAQAELCDALPACQVIASGGVGTAAHVRALCALARPNLEGVIVGKALYDGRVTFAELLAATKAPA